MPLSQMRSAWQAPRSANGSCVTPIATASSGPAAETGVSAEHTPGEMVEETVVPNDLRLQTASAGDETFLFEREAHQLRANASPPPMLTRP